MIQPVSISHFLDTLALVLKMVGFFWRFLSQPLLQADFRIFLSLYRENAKLDSHCTIANICLLIANIYESNFDRLVISNFGPCRIELNCGIVCGTNFDPLSRVNSK